MPWIPTHPQPILKLPIANFRLRSCFHRPPRVVSTPFISRQFSDFRPGYFPPLPPFPPDPIFALICFFQELRATGVFLPASCFFPGSWVTYWGFLALFLRGGERRGGGGGVELVFLALCCWVVVSLSVGGKLGGGVWEWWNCGGEEGRKEGNGVGSGLCVGGEEKLGRGGGFIIIHFVSSRPRLCIIIIIIHHPPLSLIVSLPLTPCPKTPPCTPNPTHLNRSSNAILLGARNLLPRLLDRLEHGLVPDAAGVHIRGLILERDVVRGQTCFRALISRQVVEKKT